MNHKPELDGERRKNDVRIALLEKSTADNKDSLIAVHKRITEFSHEIKADMRTGFEDLKYEIKESAKGCVICKKEIDGRLSKLEAWRNRIVGAYGLAIIAIGAWFSHQGKR